MKGPRGAGQSAGRTSQIRWDCACFVADGAARLPSRGQVQPKLSLCENATNNGRSSCVTTVSKTEGTATVS
jgi:hypothetical protein